MAACERFETKTSMCASRKENRKAKSDWIGTGALLLTRKRERNLAISAMAFALPAHHLMSWEEWQCASKG